MQLPEISEQTALSLFMIIQSIWTFIFLPLSIYYSLQFWKLHKSNILFISKRRPSMVILSVILINIYMVISKILTDLPHLYHNLHDYHHHGAELIISDSIYVIAYIILFRVWLLYYDYQYEAHLLSIKWKRHILKQRDYSPWTMRHRWLGNMKVIITIIIICWGLSCALVQIGSEFIWTGENDSNLFVLPTFIIFSFGLIFMGCKIRKHKDAFYLKREFKMTGLVPLFTTTCYVILMFTSTPGMRIRYIINNILPGIAGYGIVLVSTKWVIQKYQEESAKAIADNVKRLPLKKILSTKDGFKLFADHLVKELSIEHLFFLYEVMQIKQELLAQKVLTKENCGRFIKMDYHNKKRRIKEFDERRMKYKIRDIIETYIDQEGDHGINISSFTRVAIMDILDEIYEDGLGRTADLGYVNAASNSTWMPSDTEYTTDKSGAGDQSTIELAEIALPRDNSLNVNIQAALNADKDNPVSPDLGSTSVISPGSNSTVSTAANTPAPSTNTPAIGTPLPTTSTVSTPATSTIAMHTHTSTGTSTLIRAHTPSIAMPNFGKMGTLTRDVSMNSITYLSAQTSLHDDISNGQGVGNPVNVVVIYINKINDAVDEVVKLLRGDSLRRFYDSDEYQRLIKDIYGHDSEA